MLNYYFYSPDQLSQQLFSSLKNFRGSAVTFGGTRTSVNTFFWEAFKLLLPGIRSKLQDQARKYIITGHSLGGAMATILSIFMKDDGVSTVVYIYNQALPNKK